MKEEARKRIHVTCYDETPKAPISRSAYTKLGLRVNADVEFQNLLTKKSPRQIHPIFAKVEDAIRRYGPGGEIRGVKGEAVVTYREPLTTKEMQYPRLSYGAKNMTN